MILPIKLLNLKFLRDYLLVILLMTFSQNAVAIEKGINGHARGDVIAITTDDQIVAWCDFNKQIVITQFNVLCVYNGSKKTVSDS